MDLTGKSPLPIGTPDLRVKVPHGQGTPASGTNEEREDEAAPQELIMENGDSANDEGVTLPVGPPILRGTYEIEGDSAVAGVGSAVHVPAKEIHKRLSSAKVREAGEPALKNRR